MFSDKGTQVEPALLAVRIEGSHRRPGVAHLINQPALQHGAAEACICSEGSCSHTSTIAINRARSCEKEDFVACTPIAPHSAVS